MSDDKTEQEGSQIDEAISEEKIDKLNDQKISMLFKAMEDAQGLVKFTDGKAGAVLAFWTAVFTLSARASINWQDYIIGNVLGEGDLITRILSFFGLWFALKSIWLAFMVVAPQNAPDRHVVDDMITKPKGLFYLNHMKPGFEGRNLYFRTSKPKLNISRMQYCELLSSISSKEAIIHELCYELQKVSFIRNSKIARINQSILSIMYFTLVTFVLIIYELIIPKIDSGGFYMNQLTVDVQLFIVLYVGHLIADYLFQTEAESINKANQFPFLLRHSIIYTGVVSLSLYLILNLISYKIIFVLFLSHLLLDHRYFIYKWCLLIKRMADPSDSKNSWVIAQIDQTFHIIVLLILAIH